MTTMYYPNVFEAADEVDVPEVCAMCADVFDGGALADLGICRVCAARLPRVGGCGLGLAVALVADADTARAVEHLSDCPRCAAFLAVAGEASRIADMDRVYAASLQATA